MKATTCCDGEITILVGDEVKTARKGPYVLPRDKRHAFCVDTETARFLTGYAPASLEACVVEKAMRTTQRVLLPENASPTMAMFVTNPELLSRYGLAVLLGPEPLRP